MFRINTDNIKSVSDSVTEAKTSYETKFSDARKKNIETLQGQDGRWAQAAETSYNAADIKMNSFKTAYGTFATSLSNAASDATDSLQPKYKDVFTEAGTSPQDEKQVKCNPDSNFGNSLEDAATSADSFATEANNFVTRASELDNEQGERDTIISSLNDVHTYTTDQATKYRDIKTKSTTFSTAVSDFDGKYSSEFSGEFVTPEITTAAQQETAQMLADNFSFDAHGGTKKLCTDGSKSGSITVDKNGNMSIKGEASGTATLFNASGEASAHGSVLGMRSSATGKAEFDVSAKGSASGSIGPNGLTGEASVSAGATVSADGSVHLGEDLPFGGVGASGHAEGFAGAEANGKATVGKGDDGSVGASVSGEAFAGAKAEASGQVDLGPLSLSGDASARAGIGADGHAGITFKDGKLTVSAGASGTLGVGAGAHGTISLDVGSIVDEGEHFFKGLFS